MGPGAGRGTALRLLPNPHPQVPSGLSRVRMVGPRAGTSCRCPPVLSLSFPQRDVASPRPGVCKSDPRVSAGRAPQAPCFRASSRCRGSLAARGVPWLRSPGITPCVLPLHLSCCSVARPATPFHVIPSAKTLSPDEVTAWLLGLRASVGAYARPRPPVSLPIPLRLTLASAVSWSWVRTSFPQFQQ